METGHNKNVTNFDTLIIIYLHGFGATYNPSNSNIAIEVLVAKHLKVKSIQLVRLKLLETTPNSVEVEKQF